MIGSAGRRFILLLLSIPQILLAQNVVRLRLVDWADIEEMALDRTAIEAFRTSHPNIDVLYEPNPGQQYEEKILTGLAAGDPPDVFLLDSKLIPTFTNKHVLLDLEPFIRSQRIDTTQWFKSALDIARRGPHLYAFPKGFSPLVVFYNKKIFQQSGVVLPSASWTWDDYLTIGQRLTRDLDGDGVVDQYGAAFTNYYYNWIPWVWSGGGDILDSTGMSAVGFLNSAPTESSLRYLIDLRKKYRVAPDVGSWVQAEKTGINAELFAGGKIAMIVDGHWRMPKYLKYQMDGNLDLGVAPLPASPSGRRVNVMYESGWCVPVNGAHSAEAVMLASFMAGEQSCRIRAAGRLEIPANINVANEVARRDSTGMERLFVDEVPYCRQPWGSKIERFSEIEWTLQDAVDEVMLNDKPLHATMTRYASLVDNQLENIRAHESFEFKPIREHSDILYFLFGVAIVTIVGGGLMFVGARHNERMLLTKATGFLFPSIFHLTIFIFTPIAFAAYLSFHQWDLVVPNQPFVGLNNFREIFNDPAFWKALLNTCVYSMNVPVGMALALVVALILNRKMKGIGLLRTLYFLPGVTSMVAMALVWMWIYHPSFGMANLALRLTGLPPLDWLNSTQTAMTSIMIFTIWTGIGYQIVIFLAGLQGIPEEITDASRVDGASSLGRFWHITVPLLRPTTLFILVTSFISSFQVFTAIYIMTGGGPVHSTDVFVYHIYQAAWEQLRMGYASAMSWILFAIVMIATWVQFRIMGKEFSY